jgi:mono/diheme cytochrome c family protein
MMRGMAPLMTAVLAMTAALGCQKPQPEPAAVTRGRAVFIANCASCHNTNPNLPGSLGPPIAGSSRELIEDRVLHTSYPVGYHPKRPSHLMQPMPWLAPKIDDLAAFLDYEAVHDKR